MIEIINKADCNGCYACYQKCPANAIKMITDNEGFWYPKVDNTKCIRCKQCIKVCPEIHPEKLSINSLIYACYRINLKKRLKSASGGFFSLLAEYIIFKNGVVFGAKFDKNLVLRHDYVDKDYKIIELQGSKYVQSKIGNSYSQAKEFLLKGNYVLFSGTPCQIQGLKKYLGKDFDNLITVDLVCHGVPSPEVWKKYIQYISKGKKIEEFIPRDKSKGIVDAPLVFKFDNGKILKQNYSENMYIQGFINNLYLRPSCYDCSFKGIERCSDITLGDFWGLNKFNSKFGDNYGISLVILHTEKGKKCFDQIKSNLNYIPATVEAAIEENPCIISSVKITKKRFIFFKCFQKRNLLNLIKKLTKPTLLDKSNNVFKLLISKIIKLKNSIKKGVRHIWNH